MLALDTSVGCGSLALLEDAVVMGRAQLAEGRGMAQTFSVAIDAALRRAAWEPASIGLVALTNGPGSFTGLRIGVTAAKFFAYATGAQLVALNTLEVIVEQLPREATVACAVMDAQRRQLFAATYERGGDGLWQVTQPCHVINLDELERLMKPTTILTGPALSRWAASSLPAVPLAPSDSWLPRAETVGQVAWRAYQVGAVTDIWQLQPRYYRPSYAEEGGR
jgi:tRNA threonylcarbamoyladenosine biosynthesis protein TsaB